MEKYYKTYIRIDTPSYYNNTPYGCGFGTEEQIKNYENAEKELIKKLNLTEEKENSSFYTNGKNKKIYFHPQSISGIMTENEALRIAKAVDESDVFQVRKKQDNSLWIDRYDEYLDISENEYNNLILEKKENIKKRMLEKFKTNRRYQYKRLDIIENILFDEFQVKTLKDYKNGLNILFQSCLDELNTQGLIIQWENENLYRTANKSELKRKKIA